MTRFFILCKRQLTQPVFWLLCLFLPISCFFVRKLERDSNSSLTVGLYAENACDFTDAVFSKLVCNSSMVFEIFDDKAFMLEQTEKNELDCAYLFDSGLHKHLIEMDYKDSITCYVSPSTVADKLSREIVFAALFRQLGEELALSLAEDYGIAADSAGGKEISALYKAYLDGDAVFSLDYQYLDTPGNQPDKAPAAAAMPVRGFIAVFLLIGGLSGGIAWLTDREHSLPVPASFSILIPLLFMSVSACSTLLLTKEAGNLIKELLSLGIYVSLIFLFVRVLVAFIRRPGTLAAAVPILTLGSLIFCPVFINLGALLPFFGVMEKLFLPYYYLMLCMA